MCDGVRDPRIKRPEQTTDWFGHWWGDLSCDLSCGRIRSAWEAGFTHPHLTRTPFPSDSTVASGALCS